MRAARCGKGATVVALATLLAACGTVERDAPPELVAGRDACLECGMIINELRFAAGYVDGEGISHGFDDLGCLTRYGATGRADPVPGVWVMDFSKHEWSRARDAWFVRCDSIPTPMGYGIIALGDSLEAARFATHGAGAFRYDALRRRVNDKPPDAASDGAAIEE